MFFILNKLIFVKFCDLKLICNLWSIIFASLTHIINAYNNNWLMHITITHNFIICHNFVIKINLKMNFASYGHFVSYENYNFFVLYMYIFITYIGNDRCVKTDNKIISF